MTDLNLRRSPNEDGSCDAGYVRYGDMCVIKGAFLTNKIDRDAHQHGFNLNVDLTDEESGHQHIIVELAEIDGILVGLTDAVLNPFTGTVHRHSIEGFQITEKTMKNKLEEAMTEEIGKVLKANENTDKEDVFLELSGVITSENFGHSHKVRLMVKEGLVIGETIEDATGHMHKFQFKIDALGAVDGEVDIAANVDNILHVHRLKIEPRSETFPFEQMSEFPENVAKKISDRPVQKGIVQKAWVPSEGAEIVELNFWGLKFPTQVQVGEWLNLHGIQAAVFQLSEFEYIARTKVPQANY